MRFRIITAVVLAAVAATFAAPSSAAPFLPVGQGAWSSTNVTQSNGCKGVTTATTNCTVTANSFQTVPAPSRETCNNASYLVTTPVIIGTNFGCHLFFSGSLALTGTGTGTGTGTEPDETTEVEIEVGACAGLTLTGPYIDVTDGAAGTYRIFPKVTVTNAAWKMQGNFVAVNISTQSVVIINVAAAIAPACKRVKTRSGSVDVTFNGVFSGTYTVL